ncbi:IMPACT family protein [Chitinophaga nivalis]|uniref:YigZ family protein n=1 Tax=Chitinophaga nivalis TaxID=2991709 RepID=A0ABT3IG36_9BACT|nr:YigZ family protein [Chitinophaga nivalis]MCW3467381.1 YigZ family protein [Chitinophaga nivalis]MCW3482927.1 YigZ family protein [Chitinophaga nivalis]
MEVYFTIDKTAVAEFKDRGSKFLAYAFPVKTPEAVKACLLEVKQEHPKATHHCFAYRLGTEGLQYRASDDGEPSGSAGKPILGQIDSKQLTDVLVVVVRYYGGTLLGVPGLINAYKVSTAMVLQLIPAVQKNIEVKYRLTFDYTIMNEVMTVVKQNNCTVLAQELQLFCNMDIGIPKSGEELCMLRLKDIYGLEVKPLK